MKIHQLRSSVFIQKKNEKLWAGNKKRKKILPESIAVKEYRFYKRRNLEDIQKKNKESTSEKDIEKADRKFMTENS